MTTLESLAAEAWQVGAIAAVRSARRAQARAETLALVEVRDRLLELGETGRILEIVRALAEAESLLAGPSLARCSKASQSLEDF